MKQLFSHSPLGKKGRSATNQHEAAVHRLHQLVFADVGLASDTGGSDITGSQNVDHGPAGEAARLEAGVEHGAVGVARH